MLRSLKSTQRMMRQLELKTVAGTILLDIAAAAVSAANDTLSSVNHGLITGDRILVTEDGTLPAPLVTATQYWIIKSSADLIKLATTHANALAGTAINLTTAGVGSNSYDLVEQLSGLASKQAHIQGTAVGIYKITFNQAFAQVPMCIAQPRARDFVASCVPLVGSVTISLDDLDETAALKDGFFDLLVMGSDTTDQY